MTPIVFQISTLDPPLRERFSKFFIVVVIDIGGRAHLVIGAIWLPNNAADGLLADLALAVIILAVLQVLLETSRCLGALKAWHFKLQKILTSVRDTHPPLAGQVVVRLIHAHRTGTHEHDCLERLIPFPPRDVGADPRFRRRQVVERIEIQSFSYS